MKFIICLLVSVVITLSSYGVVFASEEKTPDPAELYKKKCSICHSIERSRSKKKSGKSWRKTVMRMKSKGAPITDGEAKIIIRYLTDNYGK